MSRSSPRAVVARVFLGGALVAGLALVVPKFVRVLKSDPLAKYRGPEPTSEDNSVEMSNFDWKAYNKSEIVAKAHVEKASTGEDRGSINLTSVTNGVYYESGKSAFQFETRNAVYFNDSDRLVGKQGVRVFNEKMDMTSKEFVYDPDKKTLKVPTRMVGRLEGGDMKAETLAYHVESKVFEIGGIRWSGMVNQEKTKSKWSFTPQDGGPPVNSKTRGAVTTFTKFKATDGETIVLADGGEYNKDTEVLVAKGNVKYFSIDANLSCAEVTVFRKEKRAVMTGAVDMLIKPKDTPAQVVSIPPVVPVVPDKIAKDRPQAPSDPPNKEQQNSLRTGDNIREYPIAVTAARIEYWYGKGQRRAHVSGSPQARQELPDGTWRMVWADRGVYDGEKETLELRAKGNLPEVRMLNSIGDDMRAVSVLVSTKEGDDMMDADGVVMDMQVDDDELPEKKDKGDGGTSSPPPISGQIKK
ncbi:MAG: hypothetical protein JNM34_11780 [Chthonomonadaceae bacterium]|nr:hypothetical protein [Chthonomonadaceae bacterium]